MRKKKEIKPDWNKFHRWERRYEIDQLRKLEPIEKIKILDDLYKTVLKVRESLKKMDSNSI